MHPPGPPATHAASFTARHSAGVRFSGSQQRAQNANRRSQNLLTHRTTRQSVQSYAACVLQKGQTVHRAPVPSSGRTGGRAQTAMGRPSSSAWCRRSAASSVARSAAAFAAAALVASGLATDERLGAARERWGALADASEVAFDAAREVFDASVGVVVLALAA